GVEGLDPRLVPGPVGAHAVAGVVVEILAAGGDLLAHLRRDGRVGGLADQPLPRRWAPPRVARALGVAGSGRLAATCGLDERLDPLVGPLLAGRTGVVLDLLRPALPLGVVGRLVLGAAGRRRRRSVGPIRRGSAGRGAARRRWLAGRPLVDDLVDLLV